jgi:uncharacterized protein YbcV (DUF1398 family)
MFTLEQIKQAHSKVKSGADFPKYIQEIKILGGETDYFEFCRDCAATGVEKWVVNLDEMTCIYYNLAGNNVLMERIPQ